MKIRKILLLIPFVINNVYANWSGVETGEDYIKTDQYTDNGARFVVVLNVGSSLVNGKVKNELGELYSSYYKHKDNGVVITEHDYNLLNNTEKTKYEYLLTTNIGKFGVSQKFKDISFTYGANVGFTLPYNPQIRLMLSFDRMSETKYNTIPLFSKTININGKDCNLKSSGVESYLNTDVIGVNFLYDFFDGYKKNTGEITPYFGLGIGYADSTSVLQLIDLYGDLTLNQDLNNFGSIINDVLVFNKSEKVTERIAGMLMFGFSYAINESMFLDLGVKGIYIPSVDYALVNKNATRSRNVFSVKNLFYTNFNFGLRFEF